MARNTNSDRLDTNRRKLLQSLGVAGAAGLAGCSIGDDPGGDDDGSDDGSDDGFDGDVTQADAFTLLEEGFKEAGFEKPWEGEIITNENPERVQWAQIIQEELNSTEYFDLELSQFEWGTYVGRVLAGDSHEDPSLICLGWSAGFDPDYYIRNLFGSDSHTPTCCNINHYSNDTVDQLLEEGIQTFDTEERANIYEEIQREIVSASPMAFIRFGEEYDVWRTDRVHGYQTYPNNSYQWRSLYAPYAGVYTYVGEEGSPEQDGELITSIGAAPSTSDPVFINDTTSQMVNDPIYETLLAVDFEGAIRNQLAENLEQVDDTTYEFTLKQGVQFHPSDEFDFDGREMTAEDVKFSFQRYLNTTREGDVGDWLGVPETGEDETPQEFKGDVEVIDDYTLEVSLPNPYAAFEYDISAVPIVPQEAGYPDSHPNDDTGTLDLSTEPIGTGPFQFEEEDPDELYRVTRFDDHWFEGSDDVPAESPLETVTFRVIVESSVQEGSLRAGDIDIADSAPPGSLSGFEEDDQFTVMRRTSSSFDFLSYPMHPDAGTPFQNRYVRIATNRMIDRAGIVEAVYDGIGQPAYAPVSPLAGAFTSEEFQEEMATKYSRYHGRADR